MEFTITREEENKIREWLATLPKVGNTAIGGSITYQFTPTGLGLIKTVLHSSGASLDLTPYDEW